MKNDAGVSGRYIFSMSRMVLLLLTALCFGAAARNDDLPSAIEGGAVQTAMSA